MRRVVAAIGVIAVVVASVALVTSITPTNAEDDRWHGNVDCGYPAIETRDVLAFLIALALDTGVTRNCDDFHGSPPACSPLVPSSTQCDGNHGTAPTTAPGEPLPDRLDIDCNGVSNVYDALRLLVLQVTAGPSPTPCASHRPTVQPA